MLIYFFHFLHRFYTELGHGEWDCSNGFLHRFCRRYSVVSRKIVGEALDCPDYDEFRRDVLDPSAEAVQTK